MSAGSQSTLQDFGARKIECPWGCDQRIYPNQKPQHLAVCEAVDREVRYE